MRKKKSDQSLMEMQDEIVFSIFERMLKRARNEAIKAQAAESVVFSALDDMCIDADLVETGAPNADNLADAISCFIDYGEYSVAEIMREVRGAYGKEDLS